MDNKVEAAIGAMGHSNPDAERSLRIAIRQPALGVSDIAGMVGVEEQQVQLWFDEFLKLIDKMGK